MKTWHKVIIGIAGSLFIIAGFVFWAIIGLQNTLYPPAPPMPAVVSQSMPEILSRLEAVLATNAPGVLSNLQPGISAAQIAKLETQYQIQLPDEVKAIYEWHNGSVSDTNRLILFIPMHRFMSLEEALAERVAVTPEKAAFGQYAFYRFYMAHRDSWVCLFSDGAGDGYYIDLKRKASEGAIFSSFAEDTSYTFFPSPKNLMAGITACYEEGAFHVKKDSSPPRLEEEFDQARKILDRFGASNLE
jgi:cell wall assembly regulator SMI1